MTEQSNVFPLFFDLRDKTILVVGAGTIAMRRINALRACNCQIRMVAPEIIANDAFLELLDSATPISMAVPETGTTPEATSAPTKQRITYFPESFAAHHLDGCFLAIAATNDRAVNHDIYTLCKARGIFVNVCDNPAECDFYFPALFQTDELIGGLVSKAGNKHSLVKQLAQRIRGIL